MDVISFIIFAGVAWYIYKKRSYIMSIIAYKARLCADGIKIQDASSWDMSRCRKEILDCLMISILQCLKQSTKSLDEWTVCYAELFKYYLVIKDNPDDIPVIVVAVMDTVNYIEYLQSESAPELRKISLFAKASLNSFLIPKAVPASERLIELRGNKLSTEDHERAKTFIDDYKPDMTRLDNEVSIFTGSYRAREVG